uniref:Uncharacterized protein n=1 Tax=Zea mays TaxID=4577 RepID=C4J1Q1_MAIZE|nr:unknown [Zea mays]
MRTLRTATTLWMHPRTTSCGGDGRTPRRSRILSSAAPYRGRPRRGCGACTAWRRPPRRTAAAAPPEAAAPADPAAGSRSRG